MKQVVILLLLVWKDCDGKIVKRFVNEQNNTTDDSLQVNVSAGYGVHPENSTVTTVFPVFRFQERKGQKENDTVPQIQPDQISQSSQTVKEIRLSPSYQVHEKNPEVKEKNFQVAKTHRHRSVEKRIRHKTNEMRKTVNDLEHKQVVRQEPKLPAGTRIVEVLRVPAMYELRLQSDPQRLATLNTAWLSKLMNHNQFKRPAIQPAPQMNVGKPFALQPQASSVISFAQPPAGNNIAHQKVSGIFHNAKPKYLTPKLTGYQQSASLYPVNQHKSTLHPVAQVQNLGGYKPNYLRPQNYQSSYQNNYQSYQNPVTSQLESSSVKKPIQETSTQTPISFQQLSNEISSDYYQKPQALHEVPAPVLNKQSYKPGSLPKVQPTAVPNLVYGKPIDPPRHTPTQSPVPAPASWSLQDQNNLNGLHQNYQYNQGQIDPISNYYQQPHYENVNSVRQNILPTQHSQQYENKNIYDSQNYQGYRNVQNYYNDAIGDSLDQSLLNINGGVATYLNNDGTMTVSNFHHNPQLYRSPVDYEIPVTENTNMENEAQDFNLMSYTNQNNDFNNFNDQLYQGYNQDIPVTENQIEAAENQGYGLQNNADLNNLLLATARSGVEEERNQKFEPINNYGRKYMSKRLYQKSLSPSTRKFAPMEYILFVKERTFH